MKSRYLVSILSLLFFMVFFAGCGSTSGTGGTAGTMTVAMTDTPFSMSGQTVTAVTLGIDKVEVIGNGQQRTVVDSFSPPDAVNILDYTSASQKLVFPAASIPQGTYSQIRLLLDSASTTITANGTTYPLFVPSATTEGFSADSQTSTDAGDGQGTAGVKVNLHPHLTVVAGGVYGFVLDFNAQESIVQANGQFIMKPVIVATATNIAGSVSGTVVNQANMPVVGAEVEAEQNGTVVNTGVTDASGNFAINALPEGTYTLVVQNQYTTLSGTTVTATGYDLSVGLTLDVSGSFTVTAGQNTTVGVITD